jgi:hypothetical protein
MAEAYISTYHEIRSHVCATRNLVQTTQTTTRTRVTIQRWSAAVSSLVILHDKPCDGKHQHQQVRKVADFLPTAAIKPNHVHFPPCQDQTALRLRIAPNHASIPSS